MASDWRVLPVPLQKRACAVCGLVSSATAAPAGFFECGYSLYAHSPSASPREHRRQQLYARWIAQAYRRTAQLPQPQSVLDVGCGNGSLLLALGDEWPSATLAGCDPSAEAVAHATAAGCRVWQGTASSLPADLQVDLVVSVNVIEHVEDPMTFMRSMATLVSPSGSLLLACPDGGRAWLELLFVDHMWSFAASHLVRLASVADLDVVGWTTAPPALGSFQLLRLSRAGSAEPVAPPSESSVELIKAKRHYLQAWGSLDQYLLELSGDASSLACFGIGEAAGLLRAYAPDTWKRVKVCVVDSPEQRIFGEVPVIDYTGGRLDCPVLIGVRPDSQGVVAQRLRAAGCAVIRWDACIAA